VFQLPPLFPKRTCHYIRVSVVENLILTAIRKVSRYARENEGEFVERVREKSALQEEEAAVKENRKKLTHAKRQREKIGGLVKKLYEAYATGKIPENHFTEPLTDYDTEQAEPDSQITETQATIDRCNTDSVRADKFLELVKRCAEFTEFSAALLNEFVEKVIVHEADKSSETRTQQVDIYLNFSNRFELPELDWPQEQQKTVGSRGRKLRRNMTEEEVVRLRELDHIRYAKKNAAIKAAEEEEEQRTAIPQGTTYHPQTCENRTERSAS
jgi:hypothetical protein